MKPNHADQGEMQDAEIPNSDAVAIAYFKQLMAKERQKPIEEQDLDLIDECIKNIAELKGVRPGFTEDEIEQKLGALLTDSAAKEDVEKDQTAPDPVIHVTAKKRTVRFRPLIAAVVAVAILVAGCLTAYATVPSFRNWVLKLLDMPVGDSIIENNVEYIHAGQTIKYKNVNALYEQEGLALLYPHATPSGVHITKITRVDAEDRSNFVFAFNTPDYSLTVLTNFAGSIETATDYQKHSVEDITAYYWEDELVGSFMTIFVHDGCYYSMMTPDVETLILMLNHMKGV